MYVQMLDTASSPEGHLLAGKTYNLSRKEAEKYLKVGVNGRPHAIKVKDAPEEVAEMMKAVHPDQVEDDE